MQLSDAALTKLEKATAGQLLSVYLFVMLRAVCLNAVSILNATLLRSTEPVIAAICLARLPLSA